MFGTRVRRTEDARLLTGGGCYVGDVELTAGDHPITVTYYQDAGEWTLKVEWSGPDLQRQEIPSSVLFHAGKRPMVVSRVATMLS